MKNKKVRLKDYLLLVLIMAGTLVLSIYILSFYKNYSDSQLSEPVIKSVLSELKFDNLDEVLQEREFLIVYTCTSSESKCRSFENKFKEYILDNDLRDVIVYFNLGYDQAEADSYDLLNKIYNKYKHEDLIKKVNNYPSLLVFSSGKIIDLLSPNKDNNVSISNVKDFLEGYELS